MNFSINRALKLIIGVMTLGFVTLVVVGGPVDEFLNQVEEEVDERATSNPRVEIDSRSELAGIAKLSMDRAAECDSVRAHQYPDLSGTRIGSNPNCRLGLPGEGITRDYTRPADPTGPGDDVEGVDSRIRFKITQDMTLRTDREYGTPVDAPGTWFASSQTDSTQGKFTLTGVSDKKYSEIITQNCNAGFEDLTGTKYRSSRKDGATYGYILTFSTDSSSRHVSSGSHEPITDTPPYQNTGGVYCTALGEVLDGSGSKSAAMHLHRISQAESTSGRTKVKLCDGDKGYVQVNKKKPYKTAETEDTGENAGLTPKFGYVQITESSGSCRVNDPLTAIGQQANSLNYKAPILNIEMSSSGYPSLHPAENHKAFDLVQVSGESTELYSDSEVNNVVLDAPPADKCKISIRERDNQQVVSRGYDQGYILFSPGSDVPAAGTFPSRDGLGDIDGGEADDPDTVGDLYRKLSSTGLDGSSVETSNGDLLMERQSGPRLEMYGPLLCGYETENGDFVDTSSSDARARWHLCLPDDATSGGNPTDGVQVADGDFIVKECTDGSWETVDQSGGASD